MVDSRFAEILEESGLYNLNQINGTLSGKHYTQVLQHLNSFLKQYTGSTGILLSAGSKMRAVNTIRSKRYSVTSKIH